MDSGNRTAHSRARSSYAITRCEPGGVCVASLDEVPVEHILEVHINGLKAFSVACTPSFLKELVIGRLLTEGLVEDVADVERLSLEGSSRSLVKVTLRGGRSVFDEGSADSVVTTYSAKSLSRTWARLCEPLRDVEPIPWNPDHIFSLSREFAADTPLHRTTFGSHSCRLAAGGKLLYCCEDLGRHNAFDKVIGCALLDGVDLAKATVYTSGRAPVDMVEKAIRAHVPIMISKAVPTNRTVELARKYGLTLICSARPDSMKVFSDPLGCTYRVATA